MRKSLGYLIIVLGIMLVICGLLGIGRAVSAYIAQPAPA
jgi:hypothetical protein